MKKSRLLGAVCTCLVKLSAGFTPSRVLLVAICLGTAPVANVYAASSILYVHDYEPGDDNIATVLLGDGHAVTSLTGGYDAVTDINDDLTGSLSAYDAIFWNATASGGGDFHAAGQFTDLLTYVSSGGRVFVTGYDTIASPTDIELVNFLGGTSSTDFGGSRDPNSVTGVNSLSTGLIDIQGVTPTGAWSDWDTLFGLGVDTTCVASSSSAGGCQWSIRSLGLGEIAYISAGASSSSVEAAWVNTSAGGAGAYNAALRNFAYNADVSAVPVPAAVWLFGSGLIGLIGIARRKKA